MTLQIDSLDHLVLTVRDLQTTCDFYQRVLGMQVVHFGQGRTALTKVHHLHSQHTLVKITGGL